ncbi:baseplate J/gp47 family protein [Methylobacterium soli]|uniref:Baseplate J/gp47 family protein n=1 Tax=Methylobacterium soli TaxID=553447 RepID=A0A6L3T0X3_9HYPH|nr:baseplate J/gp47 family protein [Methylobacterium soli]KAB1079410.1 baseplate J/gp47 family protein [Methylobacterium soli]GJE45375.1 hypothetical protein AEGHOMDF_4569 [Methylobacterium soli]
MPLQIPSLPEVRGLSRDFLAAYLTGGADLPPNSRARVLSDDNAGLAFGAYQFIARLAVEFLPDEGGAGGEFLERWANIYVGGRQAATFATGTAVASGIAGTVLPAGSQLAGGNGATFETTQALTVGPSPAPVPIRAITAGSAANLAVGTSLSLATAVAGVNATATLTALQPGIDTESDDSLRERVLFRMRRVPQGGDADDYIGWARDVPGVTRVWVSPHEMGPGSLAVRFMMDDLRAGSRGLPNPNDIATVRAYLDERRPVTVQDLYVGAPVTEPIGFRVRALTPNTAAARNAIAASVTAMLAERAAPARAVGGRRVAAQTIFAAWVSEAISAAAGVVSFHLDMDDHVMPTNASLATLGSISFG